MKWSNFTLENVYAYFQGKIRYKLYYSKRLNWLIPLHVFEQISYRIFVMDKECYSLGSCKMCGCETVALQMADKPCDKPCYPEMMNKADWGTYKYFNSIEFIYKNKRNFELKITKRIRK